jgi:hypothetical protein
MMKFLVIGAPETGKSTVAKALAKGLGLKYSNTSDAIVRAEIERRALLREYGIKIEDFLKVRDRPYLIALGNVLTEANSSCLIDITFTEAQIITGVRRLHEFESLKKDVVVIKILRPGYDATDNYELTDVRAHIDINNDGTKQELLDEVSKIINIYASLGGTPADHGIIT